MCVRPFARHLPLLMAAASALAAAIAPGAAASALSASGRHRHKRPRTGALPSAPTKAPPLKGALTTALTTGSAELLTPCSRADGNAFPFARALRCWNGAPW